MTSKIKSLGVLLILPLLSISIGVAFTEMPLADALIKRDYTAPNDQPLTATYGGNFVVCGDHICGPGEYTKMQQELSQAQTGKSNHAMSEQSMMSDKESMMSDKGQTMSHTMSTQDAGSVLKLSNANLPLVIPLVKGLYVEKMYSI